MLPEGFIAGQLKRVREKGPLPWNDDFESPITGITRSERMAMRELIKRGELETDYAAGVGAGGGLVIRVPAPKVEVPKALPYEESPAVLAMRARRRALGR